MLHVFFCFAATVSSKCVTCCVVLIASDKEMVAKIVRSLGLRLPPVVTDTKTHLQSLFNQWLPLSQAVLGKDRRQFDAALLPDY